MLLGDGYHLSVSDIGSMWFTGVELLTLSACDTASGDLESFAQTAQNHGAKSVCGSLWPVNDESTSSLMSYFYTQLAGGNKVCKAEALQKAQVAILKGGAIAGSERRRRLAELPDPMGPRGPIDSNAAPNYQHPYYWAPFVLVGNWQ